MHLNIGGYAGAGKSTVSRIIASRHRSMWIPRWTSRPRRPDEPSGEYRFFTPRQFEEKRERGLILKHTIRPRIVSGKIYYTAIPHPDEWPEPQADTELIVSVFGSMSPWVKEHYRPGMVNILLATHDLGMMNLLKRGIIHKTVYRQHYRTNLWYREKGIEDEFDYVVYNDGTPEECVKVIEGLVGLTSPEERPALP